MSGNTLTRAALAMLKEPIVATTATVNGDGSVHVTPTWIDAADGHILVNTLRGRQKEVNVARNPAIAVNVIDPTNPFRVISATGTVVDLVEEGAQDHIDALTQRYMGIDKHPFDHDGAVRVVIRIRPDRITAQPE